MCSLVMIDCIGDDGYCCGMRLTDQFLALDAECTNAVNLARTGLNLLREMKYSVNGIPAVFSCLALGSEKLLKLTYGVSEQAKGGSWPSLDTMKKFRHSVWALDTAGRNAVLKNSHLATHVPVVRGWIDRVEENPWIDQFLKILSDYGAGGRFHDLDLLAGQGVDPEKAPSEQWISLESAVLEGVPYSEDFEERAREMRRRVDEAFRDWWTMYSRAWIHGVFGEDAKGHGFTLEIKSRVSPDRMHQ